MEELGLGMMVQAINGGKCVGGTASLQAISILDLLEWAFRRECAQLDFDRHGASAVGWGYVSSTAAIIQHEQLGCRVDGGGRSDPHPDADVVASALSVLPEARGGRPMAIRIAELARAGAVPDWMPGAAPKVVPVAVNVNQFGVIAKTEDASGLGVHGWPAQPRRNRKGVVVHDAVKYCPVLVRPTAAQISRARRSYLDWWGALLELREGFRLYGGLSAFQVTDAMPPMTPWKKIVDGES
jgi:hypothetical protein